jgi:hypothetical protein
MWSPKKSNEWYGKQGWIVGSNFIPSTAVNQLEMWQKDTFDPATIDTELGYAEKLGFNSMRVFLHNMLWKNDREGFISRINKYLEISNKHGIKTMFVLMDGVWNPNPSPGKQLNPVPFVHNSRWVQSPGFEYLNNTEKHALIENYIKGIIKEFSHDKRILMWDIFNEPNNISLAYIGLELIYKSRLAYELLVKGFEWAREINPTQPITSAVWESAGIIGSPKAEKFNNFMLSHSDVITFHCYENFNELERRILELKKIGRPVICTEYLARPKSNFFDCLPVMKKHKAGSLNWGLVSGKTQTIYPWKSWAWRPKTEPKIWFHDILRKDGTPFDDREITVIKKISSHSVH